MSDSPSSADNSVVPWITGHSEYQPVLPDLAQEIAAILIEWSVFENGIVIDTSGMMRYPHIRALTKDAPRSFKQKIELWKKCIHTLFPTVEIYKMAATEICSKGKIIGHHRHRLVHGHWRPSKTHEKGDYQVFTLKGLEKIEEFQEFWVDLDYLKAVHTDIRSVSDALHEFTLNRMWHADLGLLKAHVEP